MLANLGDIAARAFEHMLRVSPDPYDSEIAYMVFSGHRSSYAESLTRRRRNGYGDLIPQIEIVKSNIARLGKAPRAPRLP